jgi:apolipoprotein N-acyltransferase
MNFLWAAVWGCLQALCIPPLPLGPAIPLILAGTLAWLEGDPRRAARLGFLSGLVLQVAALHWIRNVMAVGPALTIGLGLAVMACYLAAFHALWAWLWAVCLRKGVPWAWPFLFTGIELLRGWGQMSFPWMHVAYDLGTCLPLVQGASIAGVYGTGLLLAATAVLLHRTIRGAIPRGWLALPAAFWFAWAGWGVWRLHAPMEGPRMRVALVQPAIPQTRKWEEAYFQTAMARTWETVGTIRGPVDLIALPETAVPDFWSWRPVEAARFARLADTSRAAVVVGALEAIPDATQPYGARLLNSAFLVRPGSSTQRYDKIRLVPFSEHLPFDNVFPALNQVKLGQSGFAAGSELPVWRTPLPWSPAICYEPVHPAFARRAVREGAGILVVLTNDGWFGNSLGPRQHWNIHRFRAVESGLSLVRAANTGISGAVDHRGIVVAESRMMADTTLTVSVPSGPGSFYGRHGGAVDALLAVAALLSAALVLFRRRRGDSSPPDRIGVDFPPA